MFLHGLEVRTEHPKVKTGTFSQQLHLQGSTCRKLTNKQLTKCK